MCRREKNRVGRNHDRLHCGATEVVVNVVSVTVVGIDWAAGLPCGVNVAVAYEAEHRPVAVTVCVTVTVTLPLSPESAGMMEV